jgi:hypothetical protein
MNIMCNNHTDINSNGCRHYYKVNENICKGFLKYKKQLRQRQDVSCKNCVSMNCIFCDISIHSEYKESLI